MYDWVKRKRDRLAEPHAAPLAEFVKLIRSSGPRRAGFGVPDFDPDDGGINARILLLKQDPGEVPLQSGFVAPENAAFSKTAALNISRLRRESGLLSEPGRSLVINWNIVPWHPAEFPGDLSGGCLWLERLLGLTPGLAVAILMGGKATAGWHSLPSSLTGHIVSLSTVHHASRPNCLGTNCSSPNYPQARDTYLAAHILALLSDLVTSGRIAEACRSIGAVEHLKLPVANTKEARMYQVSLTEQLPYVSMRSAITSALTPAEFGQYATEGSKARPLSLIQSASDVLAQG